MIINLTGKGIKELRIKSSLIPTENIGNNINPANIWYCNILENYKNAIDLWFTHLETRLSFPLILKEPLEPEALDFEIRNSLLQVLRFYQVSIQDIEKLMLSSRKIIYTFGSKDRRLLGIMNNMKQMLRQVVDEANEQGITVNWHDRMVNINGMIFGAPNYQCPIEEFVKCYSGKIIGCQQSDIPLPPRMED